MLRDVNPVSDVGFGYLDGNLESGTLAMRLRLIRFPLTGLLEIGREFLAYFLNNN